TPSSSPTCRPGRSARPCSPRSPSTWRCGPATRPRSTRPPRARWARCGAAAVPADRAAAAVDRWRCDDMVTIDPAKYRQAADAFDAVSQHAINYAISARSTLNGYDGMAGTDPGGESFAQSYDQM